MQTVPQVPQLVGLTEVLTSQPLRGLLSQSPKPAAQVKRHAESVHVVVELGPAMQAFRHIPQWVVLLRTSVSQPLLASPSQSPNPVAHAVTPHTPAEHAAAPPVGAHRAPQAPREVVRLGKIVDCTRIRAAPRDRVLVHGPGKKAFSVRFEDRARREVAAKAHHAMGTLARTRIGEAVRARWRLDGDRR